MRRGRKKFVPRKPPAKRWRTNQSIRVSPIQVIDDEGQNLGVMDTDEALRLAREKDLDLIEIAPSVKPPVCKIMDFGKFKYEKEKGERKKQKKQKETEMKGVRISFTTGQHDLEMRASQVKTFLERGDKVRIDMRLRGREKALREVAFQKFQQFLDMIDTPFTAETPPKRIPQGMLAVLIKK